MATKRVAVVFGGRSGEHEVSVMTARNVIAALDLARWQPMPCAITKTGTWLSAGETLRQLDSGAAAFDGGGEPLLGASALRDLAGCDIAFPLVHGTYGEDGTMQGLFEMADLPYTGCGVAASAIGLDKALMKALFREAGLPVPRYGVVRAWDLNESSDTAIRYVESELGYPCFVKPANGGSSVGVSRVVSREDLPAAFRAAFAYDDKAVVEQAIAGQEVECSVLGNQHPEASIVGEVVPDRDFYDYDSKYDPRSKSTLHIPARIPEQTSGQVRELALRMYRVMGCEGYARVDFFVRDGTEVIANEVNTIPGFTAISMYPKLWEATGLGYTDLLSRIIELGFERHERRSQR